MLTRKKTPMKWFTIELYHMNTVSVAVVLQSVSGTQGQALIHAAHHPT